jgi:CheY-like chemotaxis protein
VASNSDQWEAAASPADKRTHRLAGVAVLIAEDNEDNRDMLTQLLTSEGATCVASRSGAEAFEAFRLRRPDVVVADVWMPDGDGFDLIGRIRALSPERGGLVPAIAISGGANAEQTLMAGFHALLRKPVEPDHVVEVVDDFVRCDGDTPSPIAPWKVESPAPGIVELTYVGWVRASDARASMLALVDFLERQPCRLTVDLREVTGFARAGAYVSQRIVWPHRQSIVHTRIIAKRSLPLAVASAACRTLGIGCTVESA